MLDEAFGWDRSFSGLGTWAAAFFAAFFVLLATVCDTFLAAPLVAFAAVLAAFFVAIPSPSLAIIEVPALPAPRAREPGTMASLLALTVPDTRDFILRQR